MIAITQNDESIKNETLSENNPDIQLFFEKQLKEFNEKISSLVGKRTHGAVVKKDHYHMTLTHLSTQNLVNI
nr:hypothetical protein [Mycoplasmopsis bovis]